ncbi:MAG: type II toxin-antitoxin system VapC family toxin [Gemmatimonadetes bacterium]|nr:type II toxin-antitoxin system VapC family toxin [Gemmatimonadota bacterium]
MIFVDSGAWIALSNQRDQNHTDAVTIYADLKRQRARFFTTDYVLDETITRLRYDVSHSVAVQFLDFIERAEKIDGLTVAEIDKTLFQEAKRLFRQYDSAKLSFTDCTSFAVCQKHNISETYAFDEHFAMMGITVLKTVEQ